MSDFNDVVKHLDIVPSRKATKSEAEQDQQPFSKYYNLIKSRSIKKLRKSIILTAFEVQTTIPGLNTLTGKRRAFQYNITMPSDFYLMNPIGNFMGKFNDIVAAIRWREGSTVHRYNISTPEPYFTGYDILSPIGTFDTYAAQRIGKNCVVEVYYVGAGPYIGIIPGILNDITLETSLLVNPSTPDDIVAVAAQPDVQDFNAIALDVPPSAPPFDPWIFPLVNSTTAWLTN